MIRLRFLTLPLLLLVHAACATTPAAPPPHVDQALRGLVPLTQVQGRTYTPLTVEQGMRENNVPAVSIAVIDDGRIVWSHAWGLADVEGGRQATTNTLFQAASVSKPVTATAVLRLVDKGRLSLDEDVSARLRSWTIPPFAFEGKVTPRRLISHTAGFTVHGFPGYKRDAAMPTVVQILNGEKPANNDPIKVDIEPGSAWRYSGGGYVVAQLLLSDITGKRFADLMREEVLVPAGMANSTFQQPVGASLISRTATAYDDNGKAIEGKHHVYPEMAPAGLWTTPSDLARWLLSLDKILAPETLKAMFTEQKEKSRFGLGIGVNGSGNDLEVSHSGSNKGFRAMFRYYPARRQGVVVMTNSDNGAAVVAPMMLALTKEYGWPVMKPTVIVPIEVSAATLGEYAGTFSPADRPLELVVTTEGTKAFMTLSGRKVEIVPTAKDVFTALQGGSLRFERDESGKVTKLNFSGRTLTRKE
jgi:CubicO group peptidase (beta-lactamase class C family)